MRIFRLRGTEALETRCNELENEDPALTEMVKMLQETRWEIRALCEVLIDRGVATLDEIDAQIEMAKLEDEYDQKEEAARRARRGV